MSINYHFPSTIPPGYVLLDDDEPLQNGDMYWSLHAGWIEADINWGTPKKANSNNDGHVLGVYPFYRPGGPAQGLGGVQKQEKLWLNPWE